MTSDVAKKLEQLIDSTRQDVRFALRQIARRPGFSALVAVLAAARGVRWEGGATTGTGSAGGCNRVMTVVGAGNEERAD